MNDIVDNLKIKQDIFKGLLKSNEYFKESTIQS